MTCTLIHRCWHTEIQPQPVKTWQNMVKTTIHTPGQTLVEFPIVKWKDGRGGQQADHARLREPRHEKKHNRHNKIQQKHSKRLTNRNPKIAVPTKLENLNWKNAKYQMRLFVCYSHRHGTYTNAAHQFTNPNIGRTNNNKKKNSN